MTALVAVPGTAPSPPAPGLIGWALGHLPQYKRDRIAFFTQSMKDHGEVVAFRFGHIRAFLINRPEFVQQVMLDNIANYDKATPGYKQARIVLGDGLFTSEGELWKRQHKLIQPAFQRERIKEFTEVMVQVAEKSVAALSPNQTLDVSEWLMQVTLRIVGTTILGADVGRHADAIWAAFPDLLESINQRVLQGLPPPLWVPTQTNRRFRRALTRLDAVVCDIIAARRSEGPGSRVNLLGLLETARSEKGVAMSEQQLRDEVVTMLLAGHETTAVALSWTLYLLAKNPEYRAKVASEIDAVIGDATPTYELVSKLDMMRMCFSEALRLYPPVWLYSRHAIGDDVIGGYAVPKGSLVLISPFTMHRNQLLWPDPDHFDPLRFAKGQERHKFSYLPFGGGPRTCMGNHFAIIEAMVILTALLRRFEPVLAPGAEIAFTPALTLRQRAGLPMTLVPRQ